MSTQSVCKWCSQAIHLSTTVDIPELIWISPDGAVLCPKFAKPTGHEPVAEPASTGEPPPEINTIWPITGWCMFGDGHKHCPGRAPSMDDPRKILACKCPCHTEAARPSGPSANFMQKIGGTCLKHGEYNGQQCPKWPDCIPAAAPQPVSGDAPEIRHPKDMSIDELLLEYKQPTLLYRELALKDEIKSRTAGDAPKVEELSDQVVRAVYGQGIDCVYVEHIEFAKSAVAAILRRYFPPASTARTDGPKYKHKANCLWATPLPTGAGFWGCDCGLDKLLLDLEDYEVAAPGAPQAEPTKEEKP